MKVFPTLNDYLKRYFHTYFRTYAFGATLALAAGASSIVHAEGHAVGGSLNTFGVGVFYSYAIDDNLHIRTTLNGLSADDAEPEFSGIEYEGDFETSAVGVMVDWYPMSTGWKRNIFVSGGLIYSDIDFDGRIDERSSSQVNIGGNRIQRRDINNLELSFDEQQLSPYLGVGWGNKPRGERGVAFVTELGLTYLESPDVSLTIDDPDNLVSAQDLERERKDIEDDLGGLGIFGSVGVSYHF